MLYRITYQTQNGNQNWTEVDALSQSAAKAEFNRTWFGGPVTILKVGKEMLDDETDSYNPFILPENSDAELIKVGDRVVCIYDNLSDLRIGKEYIVNRESGPGPDYDIFVQDAITGEKDGQSRSRKRFKIVRPATRKGLAPGLTLLDVRGRKGLAPSLKS